MLSAVSCLRGLVGKSSAAELPELQLSGCVLVAVLERVGLLEYEGMQNALHGLMKVLKLPCTHPPFLHDWCTKFRMCYAANRCAYMHDSESTLLLNCLSA